VPFGLICFSVVTVWYALHAHAPDDLTGHRTRARWYTTKTEPSYDDMAVKLRRVISPRDFAVHAPSRPARKKPRPSSPPGPPVSAESRVTAADRPLGHGLQPAQHGRPLWPYDSPI
jgi:hypothetical protein